MPGRALGIKMAGMAEIGAPINLDGWQSFQIVGASAWVIFILHQKIQKMAKCTFWYWLTRVVLDKFQRAIKWLCGVCACACACACACVCACVRVCVCVSVCVCVLTN